jgi:hypothetical protein
MSPYLPLPLRLRLLLKIELFVTYISAHVQKFRIKLKATPYHFKRTIMRGWNVSLGSHSYVDTENPKALSASKHIYHPRGDSLQHSSAIK